MHEPQLSWCHDNFTLLDYAFWNEQFFALLSCYSPLLHKNQRKEFIKDQEGSKNTHPQIFQMKGWSAVTILVSIM